MKQQKWEKNIVLTVSDTFTRYQTNTSAEVLNTITNIQPKESGGGSGVTRESIVYNMAEDMLNKLPPDYVPHQVR